MVTNGCRVNVDGVSHPPKVILRCLGTGRPCPQVTHTLRHSFHFTVLHLFNAVHGRFVYNQYGWERENRVTDDGGAVAGFHTVCLEVVGGGLTDGGRRVDDRRGQSVCGWLERGKRKVDDRRGDDRKQTAIVGRMMV
eukprot:scaffold698_cov133-Alexandrium_tamarense.AAC.4